MKKIISITGLILIAVLTACDKDDSVFNHSNNSGLLSQVKFDSELYYEYVYNDLNLIEEEKSKLYYTKHNYQNGNLISSDYYIDPGMYSSSINVVDAAMNRTEWVNSTNTEKNSTKHYTYENSQIIKSENYLGISEYSYDDKNRISRQTFYRDNERTGYIDYTYDENDNLIKRLHYWILSTGVSELQTTTVYEYDDKHNPYKAFNNLMTPGRFTNSNNIIKETYTIHSEVDSFTERVQITENSYKYNTQRFPVSKNDSETYIYY